MIVETKWIRLNSNKLCPVLRKALVQSYRTTTWIPCFMKKPLNFFKQLINRIPVIVQLEDTYYTTQKHLLDSGKVLGCKVKHRINLLNSFSAKLSIKQIKRLTAEDSVQKIWYDREIEAFLDKATPTTKAPQAWQDNLGGEGVGIAVLDTGIYPHPDLTSPTNRLIAFKDFVNNRSEPYDDNGHGTHCAGDAAANGVKSLEKYMGSAPRANIIGIKVLNKLGSGAMSDMIAGLQWCVNMRDKYNIRVLSMSLGAKATTSYRDDLLCQAVEKVWETGIVVCVAAGNEGPEAGTISSPGIDPMVITVGASNDNDSISFTDDLIAEFSSRGPTIDGLIKPDMVAPGVNIISLKAPGSYLDKNNKDARVGDWYLSLSGTSMATPICAGIVALMIQKNPSLNPDQIKEVLKNSCQEIKNLAPNTQGAGLVDAHAAITST